MDSSGDSEIRELDSGSSESGGDTNRNNDSQFEGRTFTETERRTIEYAASLGDGRTFDEEEEIIPRYTSSPELSVNSKRKTTNGRRKKKRIQPAVNFGITSEKCESLLVGVSGAISLALTGTMELAIESNLVSESTPNKTEGQALGEALAECLATIPDNPITKTVVGVSTWFAFGTLALGVVFKRFLMLQMKRFQETKYNAPSSESNKKPYEKPLDNNRFVNEDGTITAPQPQGYG